MSETAPPKPVIIEDDYDKGLVIENFRRAALFGVTEDGSLPANPDRQQLYQIIENIRKRVPAATQGAVAREIGLAISAQHPGFDTIQWMKAVASRLERADLVPGGEGEQPVHAGFARRAFAWWLDSTVLSLSAIPLVIVWIFGFTVVAAIVNVPESLIYPTMALGGAALVTLVRWLYFSLFEARAQATPGKMMLGLKVVDVNGNRISWRIANRRFWGRLLSEISVVGYLLQPFTRKHQALHDKIASTMVVHSKPRREP